MRLGLVYKLTVKGTNYFLYGSTVQKMEKRKYDYFSKLLRSVYGNPKLQNIYNKYGEGSLLFEIVQENVPEDLLGEVESIWIGANCGRIEDKRFGLNMRDGKRVRFSEETKKKMSLTRTGMKRSEESKIKQSNSTKGRVFTKEHKRNLSMSLKGRSVSKEKRQRLREIATGVKLTKEQINRRKNRDHVPVNKLNMSGNFIERFNSIKNASLSVGSKSSGNIRGCLIGKYKQAYGFKWEHAKPPKKK